MKATLQVLGALYIIIGAIHSMAFSFLISPKACFTAKGLVYIYCNYGMGESHFVITMAWPLYWLQHNTETAESNTDYLSGNDRTDFVAGTVNSCMKQYEIKGSGVIPRPFAEEYCKCYANGLADRLTMKELREANSAVVDPVVQTEGKRCYQVIKDDAARSLQHN
jgi:hypothetical protein